MNWTFWRGARSAAVPRMFRVTGRCATSVLVVVHFLLGPAIADPAALVSLATARVGELARTVTAFGTVAPDPNALTTLAIPRDCMIVSVLVRAGKPVSKGDPIATVETAPAVAAQYEQAKSALVFAKKDLDHTRSLFSEQLATRSTLAAAEKAYNDANAQYSQQTRVGADKTIETLRASVNGVVTNVAVSPGDRVAANAVIASIAQRNRLVLNLGLEPKDAPAVTPGSVVDVTSAQDPSLKIRSSVVSVDAMLDPQSRLVNAVVAIAPQVAPKLILGMGLTARVRLSPQTGIVIPKSALMTDERGTYVYAVSNGKAHRRDVAVRLEAGSSVLIAAGLSPKDRVVQTGSSGLEDGMAVRER